MKCKCGAPVSQELMNARRAELEKQYGIIARLLPTCEKCREEAKNKPREPYVIRRVG